METQDRTEAFLALLAEHERRLGFYVMTMVPAAADADDILQESKIVMWRHFHKFKLGTNFGAWARKIVFHQVLAHRKRSKRDRLQFSDEFIELVSEEVETLEDALQERHATLVRCIRDLNPEHQRIVEGRYLEEESIEEIAEATGRTPGAVYRVLSRIRRNLFECVNRNLQASGA